MAACGALQEYVKHNDHDETASSEKGTVDTSSTDTHTILGRNRSLRNVVKELQRTFHMYKDTMEELIVKPVKFLEKQTHNDISAAKGQLKESEGILKQAVILLINGVDTMKEAMNKHSRKIDELWNYEECSSELSCDFLSIDFQTTTQVQNFIEHHDEIGRFYHVENQKQRKKSRAVKNISPLQMEGIGNLKDNKPSSKAVKRSANSRYSVFAHEKPLNPIPSNSPRKSSSGFTIGKRMQSSNFAMFPYDIPGTTSSQKMIGNYRRQLTPIPKSKSSKSKLQELEVKHKDRGKGMIMQGVQSDLRSLSETGPRKPEDLKQI
ncbi:Hypothetical predicted protein, partial [Mytilus galloprovincialis]